MINDLPECPFCGAKAEYFQTEGHTIGHGESGDEVGIRCIDCGNKFSTENYAGYQINERKAEAKKLWNARIIVKEYPKCALLTRCFCLRYTQRP